MALTTFTTVSGFKPSNDGAYVYVTIGGDVYQIPYADVKVTNTRATTLTDALTLLNSILGS